MTSGRYFASRRILGRRLRSAREEAGLSQREVAERLGYRQSMISNGETANRRIDVFELQELADLYGVTLEELLSPHSELERGQIRRQNQGGAQEK